MTDKTILFIGSYKDESFDGQSLKTKTYLKLFNEEGVKYIFVNTANWKKRFIKIYFEISKNIKKCDVIFLMVSFRGARSLIPLINKMNRKRKRFIYSMVGTGPLALHIRSIGWKKGNDFVLKHEYGQFEDSKMEKELSKLDLILPETDIITDLYSDFYHLKNCKTMTNFRIIDSSLLYENKKDISDKNIHLLYLSRLVAEKGIFDLINAVNNLNSKGYHFVLDIFGQNYFSDEENKRFQSLLKNNQDILYKGTVSFEEVIPLMQKYDVFCFPTICPQEGTPGVVVEALISGTPILSSRFPQSANLLTERSDSLIFDFGDESDLERKLEMLNNSQLLETITLGARNSGKRFLYENNKETLFKYIFGVE